MRLKYVATAFVIAALYAGSAFTQEGWRYKLWHVEDGKEVYITEATPDLAEARLVYVGETHDSYSHHRAQLDVIRALHQAGHDIAVGLGMFTHGEQETLDKWLAGDMNEKEFMEVFRRTWGDMWPVYRDIFFYCRDESIPMLGLNVPRSITRKVAREGFESLTKEEKGTLPPIVCNVSPEYEAFLRRVVGAHDRDETHFHRFCEAQLVWDTAMAVHALNYLEERPDTTMVVLTGSIHAWRPAMPMQVWKKKPATRQRILLPRIPGRLDTDTVEVEDADYLILGVK